MPTTRPQGLHAKRTTTLRKTVIATALLTLGTTLVAANFMIGEQHIAHDVAHLYGVNDPQFMQSMGVLLGPAILEGNHAEQLENGKEIFPAMLKAIHGARKTISFETYIYWSGEIGQAFAQALAERARAGVKTHVLLDWVGSAKMDESLLSAMRDAGVEVERYHKPSWYTLTRMNNRTHRKLLVVDGQVAFTGGVGIADEWTGDAQDPEHWRDSHFRIEGPVASQFQAVFEDNWAKATGRVLHGSDYFPQVAPRGNVKAQMFSSSPSGGADSMQLMYLLSIAAAEKSIRLANAYFVPDELSIRALIAARARGVKIQIITPGPHTDTEIVRRASRARWGELLAAGVEIREYAPTMYHCKVMIVDELLVSVGSTNFDNRSFRLNDEANLNIYDHAFAAKASALFDKDLARSTAITFEEWQARPLQEKAIEHFLSLFGAQL
ncbi:cardiolipin synthase [Uliginosibacterium sp. H3]|uniref:Cardiolipin synthase n=1 Tax=Uliginosibacterium silvisoli TaxID=3114758 RepID=A0ABU6K904_9RHOO|nr:cardiolipin synthase [Uliginosibacterium sp. H3]